MKAITIRQPYASLILRGWKRFETRGWCSKKLRRGELLAIHSSSNCTGRVLRDIGAKLHAVYSERGYSDREAVERANEEMRDISARFPFGAVLGWVRFQGFHSCSDPHLKITSEERLLGDWAPGRWAWELSNPQKLPRPIEAGGSLNVWWFDAPPEIDPR